MKTHNNPILSNSDNRVHILIAVLVVLIGVMFNCSSYVSVQHLGGSIPDNELNALRFTVSLAFVVPFLTKDGLKSLFVERNKVHMIFVIAFLSTLYNYTVYSASIFIPLGTVGGLKTSATLISDVVLHLLSDFSLTKTQILCFIICISGVLFITQPEEIFGGLFHPVRETNTTSPCEMAIWDNPLSILSHRITPSNIGTKSGTLFGYILGLSSGVFLYINNCLVKSCGIHVNAVLFWKSLIGILLSVLLMMLLEDLAFPKELLCNIYLLMHCIGVSVASTTVLVCLKYIGPSLMNFITSLHLVILLIFQYTLMKNIVVGKENWLEILGALFVFIGSVMGIFLNLFKQKKPVYKKLETSA